jgi:hypothetical protein
MNKQDRQGARTPADLERKYQFGKQFAEIMGIALDARDAAFRVDSELRSEIVEQVTSLSRDTERILMTALKAYVNQDDMEELKATFDSEFEVLAERISMNFTATAEKVTEVDGDLQSVVQTLAKHFDFSVNGLTIMAGENTMTLTLDNGMVSFKKNGEQFGWWDGVDFHTGNIVIEVNERAQLGNFAAIPRKNGNLSWLKVK